MQISKYQFYDNTINLITYDDYHQAVEDEMAIYKHKNII